MRSTRNLSQLRIMSGLTQIAYFLVSCVFSVHTLAFDSYSTISSISNAAAKHGNQIPLSRPKVRGNGSTPASQECEVEASDVAAFANGEGGKSSTVVNFLASVPCEKEWPGISQKARSLGIRFSSEPPINLNNFASTLGSFSAPSATATLERTLPPLLREAALSRNRALVLAAQAGVISRKAGIEVLVDLVEREFLSADDRFSKLSGEGRKMEARQLADTLMALGVDLFAIAEPLSKVIEEKAAMAQADTIGKFFRAFALSVAVEPGLLASYEMAADGFTRGLKQGFRFFDASQKKSMFIAAFEAEVAALRNGPTAQAANRIDKALTLFLGHSVPPRLAMAAWKDIVASLAESDGFPVMAEAIARSFSPEVIFLDEAIRTNLIQAAEKYPSVLEKLAEILSQNTEDYMGALERGEIQVAQWKAHREKFLAPWVNAFVSSRQVELSKDWMQTMLRAGLVTDASIEASFGFRVAKKAEKTRTVAAAQTGARAQLEELALSASATQELLDLYAPVLIDWVQRNEKK